LPSIALLNCVAGKLSRPNRDGIDIFGWLFGSNNEPRLMVLPPDVPDCTALSLCFQQGSRLNVALFSIPLAISIQSQVGIVLIKF
jgi:hypothetical protein